MTADRPGHRFWWLALVAGVTLAAGTGASAYVVWLVAPCHLGPFVERLSGVCGQDVWPHPAFPWVAAALLSLLVVGWVLVGAGALVRQMSSTRRMVRRLLRGAVPPSARLQDAAERVAIPSYVEVADRRAVAFCHGLLRPAVVISSGLVEDLTDEELEAVLVHEGYHLRQRDPLRILVARTVAAIAFAFPVVRDLAAGVEVASELNADRAAIAEVGFEPTARALLVAHDCPRLTLGEAAVASLDPTHHRIRHLLDGSVLRIGTSRTRVAVSAVTMLMLVAVAVAAFSASRSAAPTVTTTTSTSASA